MRVRIKEQELWCRLSTSGLTAEISFADGREYLLSRELLALFTDSVEVCDGVTAEPKSVEQPVAKPMLLHITPKSRRAYLLRIYAEHGPVRVADAAHLASDRMTSVSVSATTSELFRAGLLCRVRRGVYAVTEDGLAVLRGHGVEVAHA